MSHKACRMTRCQVLNVLVSKNKKLIDFNAPDESLNDNDIEFAYYIKMFFSKSYLKIGLF